MHTERCKKELGSIYSIITDYVKKNKPDNIRVKQDRNEGDIGVILHDMTLHIYINEQLVGYELYLGSNKEARFLSDTDLYELKDNKSLFLEAVREIRYMVDLFLSNKIRIVEESHRRLLGVGSKKVVVLYVFDSRGREKNIQLPCINEFNLLEYIESSE